MTVFYISYFSYATCVNFLLALFLDGSLCGSEASDGNAEGATGDVVEADLVAEFHRGGIAAVLAANAQVQIGTGCTAELACHLDELAYADLLLHVVDVSDEDWQVQAETVDKVIAQLGAQDIPRLMVYNKADKCDPDVIPFFRPDEGVKISAKTGAGLADLLHTLRALLPPGPAYFPTDVASDMPESFLCCEIIREKLLHNLRDEVPHGIGVELEKFMEREDGVVEIHALIYCERQSHKGIVIGHRGAMLKRIGSQARGELEDFFGTKVFLQLFVKVREDWRNSPSALKELGYE